MANYTVYDPLSGKVISDINTPMPDANLHPPTGNPEEAQKYVDKLINLISQNKLIVHHTDLGQFDPSNLEDHYRMDLKDYQVEISHSKAASDGKDQYVILFNNIKNIREDACEKVILAYMYLSSDQFIKFKMVAGDQIDRVKRAEEEKRLKEAMAPIDSELDKVATSIPSIDSIEEEPSQRDDVLPSYSDTSKQSDNQLPSQENSIF